MGPKMDIVGLFKQAALKHGLRFGVSDHLWITYKWFSVSYSSDKEGALRRRMPYDGVDPKYADLYLNAEEIYSQRGFWNEQGIPEAWKCYWFARIKDLMEQYEPDLLYCDGHIPFQEWA